MPTHQGTLPFGPLRNLALFSNHWLDNRLMHEPEWTECKDPATQALTKIAALWKEQQGRVELYGNEQSLEEAFIQPIFRALGWKLKYQTNLRGWRA